MKYRVRSLRLLAVILLVLLFISDQAAGRSRYRLIPVPRELEQRLHKYNHLIEYYSRFSFFQPHHRVNPDFLRALIIAESGGDPKARSAKGAMGLTQILYDTGRMAARELAGRQMRFRHVSRQRLRNLRPRDLYDPAVNILLACYLIAKYNHLYNGRLDLVVSAWNAGQHSIVDNQPAPYRETRNHIYRVNGYFVYFLSKRRQRGIYAWQQ